MPAPQRQPPSDPSFFPDLNYLRALEEISPGLSSQWVRWFEEEGHYRREAEMRIIRQDFVYSVLCLIAAVLVCGGLTLAVVYLALQGLQLAAGFIGVGGLAGIVGQVIQGRKSWRQPVE